MHRITKQILEEHITTTQGLATFLNRKPATVRKWAERGKVDFVLLDSGVRLFDKRDFKQPVHRRLTATLA